MKRILAIIAVLCLLLCGCSKENKQVSDTEKQLSEIAEKLGVIADALAEDTSVSDPEDEVVFEEDDPQDYLDDDPTSPLSDSPSDSSTTFHNTTRSSASATKATATPTSVEEIVKYFSQSANAVKKDKPGFVITETPTVGEVQIGKGSSTVVNALKSAAMKLVKPSEKSAGKGEDHSVFPVEGQSWACKLEPSFVKKAECKKSGNFYYISIYLKDETLDALPKKSDDCNTGKVVNVLTEEQIGDILGSIPFLKINKFSPVYTGCYVKCKINATTGKMVEATYYMNNLVNIHANNSIEGSVDFAIRQEIKINY